MPTAANTTAPAPPPKSCATASAARYTVFHVNQNVRPRGATTA